jgi:hypothetical protein
MREDQGEKSVRRLIAIAVLGVAAAAASVVPAHAAGSANHPQAPNWSQHDTAVYVVSTLNLLHTRKGDPITAMLTRKLNITEYDVYSDIAVNDLYYIELRRADGVVAGTLAYQLGWPKPQILTLALPKGVCKHADDRVGQEYRSDPKLLIGTFTSTLPR